MFVRPLYFNVSLRTKINTDTFVDSEFPQNHVLQVCLTLVFFCITNGVCQKMPYLPADFTRSLCLQRNPPTFCVFLKGDKNSPTIKVKMYSELVKNDKREVDPKFGRQKNMKDQLEE